MTGRRLVKKFGLQDIDALWEYLGKLPYVSQVNKIYVEEYENLCPGDADRIMTMAEKVIQHEVNLLGSGPVKLGEKIDWHRDYKTNIRWSPAYIRSIEYNNPDQPSDVKFPWELSRFQWTIPAAQAHLLTGDEKYAIAVKDILSQWIDENPCAYSVNWACTMEVALRKVLHGGTRNLERSFYVYFICMATSLPGTWKDQISTGTTILRMQLGWYLPDYFLKAAKSL